MVGRVIAASFPHSFRFSLFIRDSDLCSVDKLMVSFDIVSLFTTVPLQETLQICTDALYRSDLSSPSIPENLFLGFMHLAIEDVELIILCMPKLMVYRWAAPWVLFWTIFCGFYEIIYLKVAIYRVCA